MAWSWNHTEEGIVATRKNLENLPADTIHEIWREIQVYKTRDSLENCDAIELPKTANGDTLPVDYLVDDIWEFAAEYATCTDGGHKAYMCPYGCSDHMVSFTTE